MWLLLSDQNRITPLGSWTVFEVSPKESITNNQGFYRIQSLQPGTSYEVNIVGQNSVGQSKPYAVTIRTSDLIGTSGKLLGEPKSQYFHGNIGMRSVSNWIHLLLLPLLMRLLS